MRLEVTDEEYEKIKKNYEGYVTDVDMTIDDELAQRFIR